MTICKRIPFLLFLLCALGIKAQPIFPPATQGEVDAGVLRSKFVSPYTLKNYGGVISVGVTNAVNRVNGDTSSNQWLVIMLSTSSNWVSLVASNNGAGQNTNFILFPTAGAASSGLLSSNDWTVFSAVRSNINQTIYVDPTNGNDATAIAYRFDKPFKTITNAVGAAKLHDLVFLHQGDYLLTNSPLVLSNEISIVGESRVGTRILNSMSNNVDAAYCGPAIVPGSNTYVANLTITNIFRHTNDQACYGANAFSRYNKAVTNAIVENCDMWGDFDCVFSAAFPSLHFYDFRGCRLYSRVDAVALFGIGHGMRMNNCLITIDGISLKSGLGATQRGVNDTGNTGGYFDMYNCQIDTSSASNSAATYGFDNTGGSDGVPRLFNVSFIGAGAVSPTKLDVKGKVSLGNADYDFGRMGAGQTYLVTNMVTPVGGTNAIRGFLEVQSTGFLGISNLPAGALLGTDAQLIVTNITPSSNSILFVSNTLVKGNVDFQYDVALHRMHITVPNEATPAIYISNKNNSAILMIAPQAITSSNATLYLSGGGQSWAISNTSGVFYPGASNQQDIGTFAFPVRTNRTDYISIRQQGAGLIAGYVLTDVNGDGNASWQAPTGGGGGGGAATNANQFGAAGATLTLKNGLFTTNLNTWGVSNRTTVSFVATNLDPLQTTNLVADGGVANLFTNYLNQNGNLIFTNLIDGQLVDVQLFVSNGVMSQIWSLGGLAPSTSFYEGNNALATNRWNHIQARRTGVITNFWLFNRGFSLSNAANITFTTNFTADPPVIAISSSGGGGGGAGSFAANANQFNTNDPLSIIKSALVTNLNTFGLSNRSTITVLATNLDFIGTNLVIDGNIGNSFTNAIAANSSGTGLTNIVFTNMLDGQTISARVFVNNGTIAQLFAGSGSAPSSWFPDGNTTIATNSWTWIVGSRNGTITNFWVSTQPFVLTNGNNVTFTTNYTANPPAIAIAASGGGASTNANQFGAAGATLTLKDGVITTNLLNYQTLWLTNIPGAGSPILRISGTNIGAKLDITIPDLWLPTNILKFTLTNVAAGDILKVTSVANSGGAYTITITNGTDNTGGGGGPFNINQFDASSSQTNIKNGALLTNMSIRGATFPNVTVSRAAIFNSNGDITNATSASASTDFVHADGSVAGAVVSTNGNQFGAASALTIKDGPLLTNVAVYGATSSFYGTNMLNWNFLTNQIYYVPLEQNGSNGVTALKFTNYFDMGANTFNAITNTIGTNMVLYITNVTRGASKITAFTGINGYSNTVEILATNGVNLKYMNWPTNGNSDIVVKPNYTYTVQMFADRTTNIIVWVSTDDPFITVSGFSAGFSNIIATNIAVQAGGSTSNFYPAGQFFFSTTTFTNCCTGTTLTNAGSINVPAHMLTNNGDMVTFVFSGNTTNSGSMTNDLQLVYGSETFFDTGFRSGLSNGTWTVRGSISRSGNTAQRVTAYLESNIATNHYVTTLAQTNGIATTLQLKFGTQRVAQTTNDLIQAAYWPFGFH